MGCSKCDQGGFSETVFLKKCVSKKYPIINSQIALTSHGVNDRLCACVIKHLLWRCFCFSAITFGFAMTRPVYCSLTNPQSGLFGGASVCWSDLLGTQMTALPAFSFMCQFISILLLFLLLFLHLLLLSRSHRE